MDALSLSFTDPQGNFQTLKSTDTPDSVNLSVASIIGMCLIFCMKDPSEAYFSNFVCPNDVLTAMRWTSKTLLTL